MKASIYCLFFTILLAIPTARADDKPRWGKVVCSSVSESDAVQFATQNHFLDNWDFEHVAKPPYVAPKGTLSCSLPLLVTSDTDNQGRTFYRLEVSLIDQPFGHLPPCTVSYYDHSPTRKFAPNGSGDGYADLVPGGNDFDVSFSDSDQSRYDMDDFTITRVGRDSQITWSGETQGDEEAHVPIVTSCHLEF